MSPSLCSHKGVSIVYSVSIIALEFLFSSEVCSTTIFKFLKNEDDFPTSLIICHKIKQCLCSNKDFQACKLENIFLLGDLKNSMNNLGDQCDKFHII